MIRDNASHGQIEEAYRIAGVDRPMASKITRVANVASSQQLPNDMSFSVAVELAHKNTPPEAIDEIIAAHKSDNNGTDKPVNSLST